MLLLLLVASLGLTASLALFYQIDRLRCQTQAADAGRSKAPGTAAAAWSSLSTGLAATAAATIYVWREERRRNQARSAIAELARQVAVSQAMATHHRQLFEISPDPILILEAAGAIVEVNRAAEALLGRSLADVHATALRDLVYPADHSAFDAFFNEVDFGNKPSRARLRLVNSKSRPVLLEITLIPEQRNERIAGFFVVARTV